MAKHREVRTLVITNPTGLHCRPSASFVKLANKFQSDISVKKDNEAVDGKSILGLMMLAVDKGATINVSAEGPDAELALDALENLVKNDFNVDLEYSETRSI